MVNDGRSQKHGSESADQNRKPLAGVRIIDAGSIIAGPLATGLLADFGAEVISIEHPAGDPVRNMNPKKDGVSLLWKVYHRNKKAITLDLSTPEGGDVLKDLVEDADMIVENFRPGTMEKWGLGYAELSERNEDLLMARISGFGQTGPERERAGFGRIAGAMGGMVNMVGEKDGPPMFPSYPVEDAIAGVHAAFGMMIALFNQRMTNDGGQVIDLSMAEAILQTNALMPLEHELLGKVPRRHGNTQPNVAPNSVYQTSDGEYLAIPASNDNAWRRLCHAMDHEDLLRNEKFVDNKSRVENSEEINRIVREWIADHTRAEIEAKFDEGDVIYAFVYDIEDIRNEDHYQHRNVFEEIDDEELGEAIIQNPVPRLTETPGEIRHLGPKSGEHNEEVYCDALGYPAEKLQRLRSNDVI